eukprot:5565310-Prymnesium_polylepis.2
MALPVELDLELPFDHVAQLTVRHLLIKSGVVLKPSIISGCCPRWPVLRIIKATLDKRTRLGKVGRRSHLNIKLDQ